jgi:hypothetical protein
MIRLWTLLEELNRREQFVLAQTSTNDNADNPKSSKASAEKPKPWWHDKNRLLRFVFRKALEDRDFASLLVSCVGRLVEDDRRLHAQLSEALKGSRRGARGTPRYKDIMLVRDYDELRWRTNATFEEAIVSLATDYCVSPETMRSKLARALNKVSPEERRPLLLGNRPATPT